MIVRVGYQTVATCYVEVEVPNDLSKQEAISYAINIDENQRFTPPYLCLHCEGAGNKRLELGEFEPAYRHNGDPEAYIVEED